MKSDHISVIKNKPEINRIEILIDGNVKITWKEAVGAEKYIIKRSLKSDFEFKKIAEISADKLEFTDSTIKKEGIYWYRITAHKSNGAEKPFSKTGESRSINISSLAAPHMLSIKSDGKKTVDFSWNSNEKFDGYIILRRHHFMRNAVKTDTVASDCNSYTDSNVILGQLLYYSVQGYKVETDGSIRYSNPSNELCSACIDKAQILSIKRKMFKKVFFSLRLTAGADGYVLFKSYSENGEFKEVKRTKGLAALTLEDKGESGKNGAFYTVSAYKMCEEKEIIGPQTKPVYVNYK